MVSQYWPLKSYDSHQSQQHQPLPSIPEEEETPIDEQVDALICITREKVAEDVLANQLNSVALHRNSAPSESSSLSSTNSTFPTTNYQMQSNLNSQLPTHLISRLPPPRRWLIENKPVRPKILHLYRLCIHNLGSPQQQAEYLFQIHSGTDKSETPCNIMMGWFDLIIEEIRKAFGVVISREQIWGELVIMGELKTSRGYHDAFWEFSDNEGEAERLGWMMEDMGVGECRGSNGIMITGSWVLRRESWGWATCW